MPQGLCQRTEELSCSITEASNGFLWWVGLNRGCRQSRNNVEKRRKGEAQAAESRL